MRRYFIAALSFASVVGGLGSTAAAPVLTGSQVAFVCQVKGDPGVICPTVYKVASVVCNSKHPCG